MLKLKKINAEKLKKMNAEFAEKEGRKVAATVETVAAKVVVAF